MPQGIPSFFAYFLWLNIENLQDSSSKEVSYDGIFTVGIRYSKAVPPHEINPLYSPIVVKSLEQLFQCLLGTSLFAIAIMLVCLASDASKS